MRSRLSRHVKPLAASITLLGTSGLLAGATSGPLAASVACGCGGGETPHLAISASPTTVTKPKPKSTITISDVGPGPAVIKTVEAEEKENSSQWSFVLSKCNGVVVETFKPCTIPVEYIGELKSKVTFVALDENGLSSGTATITATPPIQPEPSVLAFGNVKVGTEVKKKLKIKANENVNIKAISSSGASFKVVVDSCSGKLLEAGKECEVEIGFLPTEKKSYSNTLKVPYEIVSSKFIATKEISMTGEGS